MKRSLERSPRAGSWPTLGGVALTLLLAGPVLATACGDDDGDDSSSNGTGGSAGTGGGAGSGGSGMAGSAGSGMAGNAGAGGSSSASGPTGSIQVLSDDASRLLGPTTAALRGQNVWVANGQLGNLFSDMPMPQLPFSAVSIPLAGGDVGDTEIELDGNDFYPEGIAVAADGTLYIGSIGQSTIVRVPVNSTEAEEFLASEGIVQTAVIGLKVDDDRGLLWFCDSDPRDMPRTGAVVGVSLDDGEEVVRHQLEAEGQDSLFCNDLIVDPDGNLWITESIAGIIYRIDAGDVMDADSAEIWMNGGLAAPVMPGAFAANGLALVDDLLIVANAGGSLFVVDPDSTDPVADARPISLFEGNTGNVSLCGPDGLLAVPGTDDQVVVVENGGCTPSTPRVVRITLDLD